MVFFPLCIPHPLVQARFSDSLVLIRRQSRSGGRSPVALSWKMMEPPIALSGQLHTLSPLWGSCVGAPAASDRPAQPRRPQQPRGSAPRGPCPARPRGDHSFSQHCGCSQVACRSRESWVLIFCSCWVLRWFLYFLKLTKMVCCVTHRQKTWLMNTTYYFTSYL